MPVKPSPKQISYPEFAVPAPGEKTELAPGVYWLRMPLPFELNHINLYLLEDSDGWFIIDTGLGGSATRNHWRRIFETQLNGKPVKGVIVTHMHPDHMGQAGYLTEHWRVPLYMSRGEYFAARALSSPPTDASQWPVEEYYRRSGLDHASLDATLNNERGFASVVEPITRAYQRLQHGDELRINDQPWRVMIGRGHSPEHACLYNSAQKILLSGDQILPAITPNISVFATEPEANPLADYLDSLPQFKQLPEDTLVLPAHNRPFYGLHERVSYMREHHEQKLDSLLGACQTPTSALELLPVLFKRELNDQQLMFALGECISHLNFLIARGDMERSLSTAGTYHYTATSYPEPVGAEGDEGEEPLLQV